MVALHPFEVGYRGRTLPLMIRLTALLSWHDGFVRTLTATTHLVSPGCISIVVVFRIFAHHSGVIVFHIIAAGIKVILVLGPFDRVLIMVAVFAIACPISVAVGLVFSVAATFFSCCGCSTPDQVDDTVSEVDSGTVAGAVADDTVAGAVVGTWEGIY